MWVQQLQLARPPLPAQPLLKEATSFVVKYELPSFWYQLSLFPADTTSTSPEWIGLKRRFLETRRGMTVDV